MVGIRTPFLWLFGAIVALIIFIQRVEEQIALTIEIVHRNYVACTHSVYIWGRHVRLFIYYSGLVQTIQGFSAFKAGLMLLPGGIVSMIVFPIAGVSTAVDLSHTIAVGLAIRLIVFSSNIGMLTGFWVIALLLYLEE